MKIGILTFHRAINYGAVLQCYALYKTIEQMGHEVEVIDYRPPYIEKYRKLFSMYDFRKRKGVVSKLRFVASSLVHARSKMDANRRFDEFLNSNLTFSRIVRKPEDMPQHYDVIMFGSDQIWSPQICDGFDPIYWGQFPHAPRTRLITYAASLGGHNQLSDSEWKKAGEYLKSFSAISVREEQLRNDLRLRLGITSELVVDPTLLVNENMYNQIAVQPTMDNYVLVFSVAPTDNLMGFAEKVADQTGAKIVSMSAKMPKSSRAMRKIGGGKFQVAPSIETFLGLFKHANCIVTVSFHGTVFSVIFKKDFYSLHNYMQDRAEHLLQSVGLQDRLVGSDATTLQSFKYSHTQYGQTDERLTELRVSSQGYLREALGTA